MHENNPHTLGLGSRLKVLGGILGTGEKSENRCWPWNLAGSKIHWGMAVPTSALKGEVSTRKGWAFVLCPASPRASQEK